MKFKLPLLVLIVLVSLSLAVAHDNEKGKTASSDKSSCCMDAKKVSEKSSDKCTMDKAGCPMVDGKCVMENGAKASVKKTGSSKIVKASATKSKLPKSTATGTGTN